jgi:hypothetical protein
MSYRDLQAAKAEGLQCFHDTALAYAQHLWSRGLPARAILALSRALYIEPDLLAPGTPPPYAAYLWLLSHYKGQGFLGNPRISFFHQATRMDSSRELFRRRAWAMWHLTMKAIPGLSPDPCEGSPPAPIQLAAYLDKKGLESEGEHLLACL